MTKSFEQEFAERLTAIENRAHKVGMNMTAICREAGISRATPERWKKTAPKTVELVSKMEQIVSAEEQRVLSHLQNMQQPQA